MAKHSPKLSAKLEAELKDRLEDLLDAIDDADDKRRRINKHLRGHIQVLSETKDLVRRQLKGKDLDQLDIPGTEVPAPAEDPLVQEILKLAGGIVEPVKEDGEIDWHKEGDNHVADVDHGTYCVQPPIPPEEQWALYWTPPGGGKSKRLGLFVSWAEGQRAAERDHLEHLADEKFKNAGAGDLTRADTKGDAVARKRGRRG